MPDAMADQIADDVLAAIDAATLSQSFTPTRDDLPRPNLTALSTLTVTVVPRSTTWELLTRAKDWEVHQVDVGVLAKVADTSSSTLAPYRRLAEEIAKLFRNVVLDCGAAWHGSQIDPIYDDEALAQSSVFVSIVRLTFKVRT